MSDFLNKRVTVLGLGRFGGGIAVARWLAQQGAKVTVADQSTPEQLADSIDQLGDLNLKFCFGAEVGGEHFQQTDLVVASPAVAPTNPLLQMSRTAGIPITSEICLFVQRCQAPIIGVTGTKGKSTTSTLLHRMLSTKYTTWFGGNIGKSLLADLPKIASDHLVVLELSSFMLEHLSGMKWSPHIAVVTMVSSDHLDWHGSEEKYLEAKRNIVRYQKTDDFAVLNSSNPQAWSFRETMRGKIVAFNGKTHPRFALKLAGEHNQLNAQAAFTAAAILNIKWDAAQSAIETFSGLSHRLQLVHESDGVQFINDSISTIPEAAMAALGSFPKGRVIQIVGGSGKKHLPVDALCAALAERAKAVLCVGETADQLARLLPSALARNVGDLGTAVQTAKSIAGTGDVVLLSPGHPSYDQFINFESRGTLFTQLVQNT